MHWSGANDTDGGDDEEEHDWRCFLNNEEEENDKDDDDVDDRHNLSQHDWPCFPNDASPCFAVECFLANYDDHYHEHHDDNEEEVYSHTGFLQYMRKSRFPRMFGILKKDS